MAALLLFVGMGGVAVGQLEPVPVRGIPLTGQGSQARPGQAGSVTPGPNMSLFV